MSPRGERPAGGPVQLHAASVHVPLSAVVAGWLARGLGRGLRRACASRMLWAVLAVAAAGLWITATVGSGPLLALAAAGLAGLVAWRLLGPGSFRSRVAWPLRGATRRAWVYRRGWQPAMVTTGLAAHLGGREYLPTLVAVASTGTVDRVTVRMLPGQVAEDYAGVADRLAQTFDAAECRVRTVPAHRDRVCLWLLVRDPLTEPVAPLPPADAPDLAGLALGTREDGVCYRLRLLGSHLLIVGATGSGKGSVLWSLIAALAPALQTGRVVAWVLDPKGGMELAGGRGLFARFCHGTPDTTDDSDSQQDGESDRAGHERAYAGLLEDAVEVMRERQARLRGITRLHQPNPTEPLVVILVDELAAVTAYVVDREAKRRIAAALSLLLSQGRAVGVVVVAALQDPRKEVLPARDLFPTRIGLRLSEPDQVDMVLGEGARRRGARCDQIPETLPGVGYVTLDGVAEPVRVRFTHHTDADIATLTARHGAATVVGDAADEGTGAAA